MQARSLGCNQYRRYLWLVPVIVIVVWQRMLLWQAITQLFLGMLVAMAALPLMKWLEKKLKPGLAASLAMTGLSVGLIGFVLLFVPPMIAQGRQIIDMLPGVYAGVSEQLQRGQLWLEQNGMRIDEEMKGSFLSGGEALLSGGAKAVVGWLQGVMGGLGQWMLAPVFAYYFLRDRKRIGEWLLMLVPAAKRRLVIRVLREMRRETAGYLRGQLLISAVVGGLTAVGLLFCGVPGWLLLGTAMGVLELIPYAGPFLGGVLVFLFSWQNGWKQLLWAMGVVLLVQQLEGGMLSPQLMSDATRLHPIVVLLCVMLGGASAGIAGILLAVPLVLCVRAALRVLSLR
ncbi:MAG: AI-2E family transporter [Eubacteriales bacterium]|nr:AI-2E family transporter [Eubacteriales bacterium]